MNNTTSIQTPITTYINFLPHFNQTVDYKVIIPARGKVLQSIKILDTILFNEEKLKLKIIIIQKFRFIIHDNNNLLLSQQKFSSNSSNIIPQYFYIQSELRCFDSNCSLLENFILLEPNKVIFFLYQ